MKRGVTFLAFSASLLAAAAGPGCDPMTAEQACEIKARAICDKESECYGRNAAECYEELSEPCPTATFTCGGEKERLAIRQCIAAIRELSCVEYEWCVYNNDCPEECDDPCAAP
jgi:hypothetical protein